jgi:hypothetical protein
MASYNFAVMKNLLFCLLIAFIFSVNSFAQELTPLEIAKKTVEANGGENWRRPKTLQLSGTATIIWKGKTYTLDNYKMWRVFPDANDNARGANGKVRFDAFAGDKLFFQIAFDGKNTMQNLSDEAKANEEMLRWSNNFGFSIFRFIESEGFTLARLPDDKVDGFPCYFIKITDAKKSVTMFGIDKKTFYIRYAAFDTPLGFHHRIYSDFKWHKNPKFIQPRSLRIFNDGVKTADIFWREFKVNQPIEDKVFSFTQIQ